MSCSKLWTPEDPMNRRNQQTRSGLIIPPSAQVTMAATRRSFLRNAALGGALLATPGLLAACGNDSGGGSGGGGGGGPVSFGVNEAKWPGPANERDGGFAAAYTKKTGIEVNANYVDHNTFQESINTYLQGSPDDVFTWFAGFRMQQFAEDVARDISDVWPIDGWETPSSRPRPPPTASSTSCPTTTTRGRSSTRSRCSRRTTSRCRRPTTTSSPSWTT
ncbi:MAG: hypothetical protein R2734_13790 [Nocardioides sp.]